MAMIGKLL